MLTTPGGSSGLPAHVGEDERGQRRRLGRLEHDRVAARERRRDLPREHQQREVPGDDLRRDPERLRPPVREGVLELVGPAGVVEEVRGRERQVDVARLLDRLAAVERLGDGELARALLEDAGDAEEVLRALCRAQRRPAVREGLTRRRRPRGRRPRLLRARPRRAAPRSPARRWRSTRADRGSTCSPPMKSP